MQILRIAAHLLSVLFHPLIIMTYVMILLLLINPYAMGLRTVSEGSLLILQVFMSSFLIPAFATLMLRLLGFVESLQLKDRQERIGPYIICGTFYMVLFLFFYRNHTIPNSISTLFLGTVIAIFIAFFINNFSKISIHTVAMGGLVGMLVVTMMLTNYAGFTVDIPLIGQQTVRLNVLLIGAILIAGLVGSARMLVGAHTPGQIYSGYLVGFASQFIAYMFLF